jgi:hypothetical protein
MKVTFSTENVNESYFHYGPLAPRRQQPTR